MHKVALLIGGNQGDRRRLIHQATELIQKSIGSVVLASGIYETKPWGCFELEAGEQNIQNFLNQALLVETERSAHEVLGEALLIEAILGRLRKPTSPPIAPPAPLSPLTAHLYHSRPMDIDIIFYDDIVLDTPDLTLPHPRMHLRRFVLESLAEIIPDYRHPVLHKTVRELLDEI